MEDGGEANLPFSVLHPPSSLRFLPIPVASAPEKCFHQIRANKLATGHAAACLGQRNRDKINLPQTGRPGSVCNMACHF
jgi:hypothetical protein